MSFYDDKYFFTPDYSTILDYQIEDNFKLPSYSNVEIFHSLKNVDYLINEPVLQCPPIDSSIKKFDKEKQKIIDFCVHQNLRKHTIMLVHRTSGLYEGIASAVYILYKKKKYIITAGHTFSNFKVEETCLFLNNSTQYSLTKCKGIIYPPCRKDDFLTLDYAIIYVDWNLENCLTQNNYSPFDVTNSLKNGQNGIYNFYYGFPETYNRANKYKSFEPKPICFELEFDTKLLECNTLEDINCKNPEIDYLDTSYNYYQSKLISTENIGTKKLFNMPSLHGMSGCGIWRFSDYPFDAKNYYLEGMFLGGYNSKLYFDKLEAVIKYWNLLKIPEDKILQSENMMILQPLTK